MPSSHLEFVPEAPAGGLASCSGAALSPKTRVYAEEAGEAADAEELESDDKAAEARARRFFSGGSPAAASASKRLPCTSVVRGGVGIVLERLSRKALGVSGRL